MSSEREAPTCPMHGDPLVCLACEADDDRQPVWLAERQRAIGDAFTAGYEACLARGLHNRGIIEAAREDYVQRSRR